MALEGLYQLGRQAWCSDSRVLGSQGPEKGQTTCKVAHPVTAGLSPPSATWTLPPPSTGQKQPFLWSPFQGAGQPSRASHVRRTPCDRVPAAPTLPRRHRTQCFQRLFNMPLRVSILHQAYESACHASPLQILRHLCAPHTAGQSSCPEYSLSPSFLTTLWASRQYCHPHQIKKLRFKEVKPKAPCSPSFHLLFPLPGILFPVTVPSCVHTLQVSPQLSPESPSLSTCPAVFLPGAHPSQGTQASSCVCFLSLFSNQSSQGGTREQGSQSDSFLRPPAHTAAQHRHGTHQGQSQHVRVELMARSSHYAPTVCQAPYYAPYTH